MTLQTFATKGQFHWVNALSAPHASFAHLPQQPKTTHWTNDGTPTALRSLFTKHIQPFFGAKSSSAEQTFPHKCLLIDNLSLLLSSSNKDEFLDFVQACIAITRAHQPVSYTPLFSFTSGENILAMCLSVFLCFLFLNFSLGGACAGTRVICSAYTRGHRERRGCGA